MSDVKKAAEVHANSMAVLRDIGIRSMKWGEYRSDFLAGAAWQREQLEAERVKLREALRKITSFCPAAEEHGKPEDCHIYGCLEGREALKGDADVAND